MKKILLLFSFSCMLAGTVFSNIKTPVSNSSNGWSTANNWLPTGVPANGDTILIPASFTFSVKGNIYNSAKPKLVIYVYGTIEFDPSGRIDLAGQSEIYLFSGGSIYTNGNSSERILINGKMKFNGHTDGNITGPRFANVTTGESPYGFIELTILPVKLVEFLPVWKKNHFTLHWNMINDKFTSMYELERKRNKENWQLLKTFTENGSEIKISNKYEEERLPGGVYEYRLKCINPNGLVQYSKTVAINVDQPISVLKVFPNPVHSVLEITVDRPIRKGYISLSNAAGIKVYESSFTGLKKTINISHLLKGIYTINYTVDNSGYSELIIIR